jgi:hypothetical protein
MAAASLKQAISLPEMTMQTEFRFRLNGDMPEIFIQRALVDGEPVGEWQIAVDIDYLDGRFTIDDNSNLWDPAPAGSRSVRAASLLLGPPRTCAMLEVRIGNFRLSPRLQLLHEFRS